jgi:hypothetical protein
MELLMRDAQCRGAIVKLRNQLVIKARFLNYKSLHSRHQGANTRSRTIVNRNELKIRLHSEKYQVAWAVLFSNTGQKEAEMGWRKLRKEDIRCMEDAEDVKRKAEKRKRAKERRKKKLEELLSHGAKLPVWVEEGSEDEELMEAETGAERGTESRREISWIWTGAALSGTDAGLEDGEFFPMFFPKLVLIDLYSVENRVGKGVRAVSKMGRGGAVVERGVSARADYAGMAGRDVGAAGERSGCGDRCTGAGVRGGDGGICAEAGGVVP